MMFSLSFVGGSISANGFGPGGPNLGAVQIRWDIGTAVGFD